MTRMSLTIDLPDDCARFDGERCSEAFVECRFGLVHLDTYLISSTTPVNQTRSKLVPRYLSWILVCFLHGPRNADQNVIVSLTEIHFCALLLHRYYSPESSSVPMLPSSYPVDFPLKVGEHVEDKPTYAYSPPCDLRPRPTITNATDFLSFSPLYESEPTIRKSVYKVS